MDCLNSKKVRLALFGIVAVIICSRNLRADFVFCDPRPANIPINSPGAGGPVGCSFLPDGLKLYFGQNRNPGNWTGRDVWVVERESTDAPWGEAVNLGPNINTPQTRGAPAISPDDLELHYSVWSPDRETHLIMRSTRSSTDEPWGPAAEFTRLGDEAQNPDFASDGLSMYFDSRRPGGHGGRDIWVATRATTQNEWREPVNLGPNVNDSDNQNNPSISNDGLALFFVNWTTRRMLMCIRATTDDGWGPAIDLGPAVNGQVSWVSRPEISPDGSTLYFSSPVLFQQVSIKPVVDFDDNGSVGMDDLLTMIESLGTDNKLCDIGPMPWGDGVVDEADLEVLMDHWGEEDPVYIVVDNFESYNDDIDAGTAIWQVWIDSFENGTGALSGYEFSSEGTFCDISIVHTGFQAMPFTYDNDGTLFDGREDEMTGLLYYSETQHLSAEPQDWTRKGVEVLSLWFYGNSGNAVEPFYIALEDSAGNRKEVQHPDPAAVTIEHWEQWTIPLADFTGVDPTIIKIIGIGVGDPASSQPGGSGLVRIDDIELHLPATP